MKKVDNTQDQIGNFRDRNYKSMGNAKNQNIVTEMKNASDRLINRKYLLPKSNQ